MKKLFLSLGLALGTMFSVNATDLVIENQCHTYVCIQSIQTSTLNGISYEYYNGLCGFSVNGGGTIFHISDGNINNYQFPFLNVWPFTGNVMEETTGGSTVAMLPLLSTSDNECLNCPPNFLPATERYQLRGIKFQLNGASGTGFGPLYDYVIQQPMEDNANFTGIYNYLPGMPQYEVTYFHIFEKYYFLFEDI